MMNDSLIQHLSQTLQKEAVLMSPIQQVIPVSGGSVNETYAISDAQKTVFIKLNSKQLFPNMFEKEKRGLELLREATSLHVPQTILLGENEHLSYLVMEYVKTSDPSPLFWENFGAGLAQLHQNGAEQYGLTENNYNGSLNQSNKLRSNWVEFFVEERLRFQEKLALDNGKLDHTVSKSLEKLYHQLPNLLPQESPALLHGDLWSGNFMVNERGEASIMDPAVYYGHREVDISMSLLFGGFDKRFYQTYNSELPLEKGWESRVDIYNLYPLLVHVNLFGASYSQRVKSILKRLV